MLCCASRHVGASASRLLRFAPRQRFCSSRLLRFVPLLRVCAFCESKPRRLTHPGCNPNPLAMQSCFTLSARADRKEAISRKQTKQLNVDCRARPTLQVCADKQHVLKSNVQCLCWQKVRICAHLGYHGLVWLFAHSDKLLTENTAFGQQIDWSSPPIL